MSRRTERQKAVELLYEMTMQKEDEAVFVREYFEKYSIESEKAKYVEKLLKTYFEHKADVNTVISENIQRWKIERLGKIDASILRLATTEMLYFEDVPAAVSINEAVELAKIFSEEKGFKFINKVLRNIFEAVKGE